MDIIKNISDMLILMPNENCIDKYNKKSTIHCEMILEIKEMIYKNVNNIISDKMLLSGGRTKKIIDFILAYQKCIATWSDENKTFARDIGLI